MLDPQFGNNEKEAATEACKKCGYISFLLKQPVMFGSFKTLCCLCIWDFAEEHQNHSALFLCSNREFFKRRRNRDSIEDRVDTKWQPGTIDHPFEDDGFLQLWCVCDAGTRVQGFFICHIINYTGYN